MFGGQIHDGQYKWTIHNNHTKWCNNAELFITSCVGIRECAGTSLYYIMFNHFFPARFSIYFPDAFAPNPRIYNYYYYYYYTTSIFDLCRCCCWPLWLFRIVSGHKWLIRKVFFFQNKFTLQTAIISWIRFFLNKYRCMYLLYLLYVLYRYL